MAEEGTVAYISEERMCDICKTNGDPTVPAQYDAATKMGPWASMCLTHFTLYGPGRLGTGVGQRLVVKEFPVYTIDELIGLDDEDLEDER